MTDRKWAEYLEQVEKNKTWEQILEDALNKKYVNTLDEAYEEIIRMSTKGREPVSDLFKIRD